MANNGHLVIGKSDVANLKGGSGPRRFSCTAAAVLSIAVAVLLFGPGAGPSTIRDAVHTFQADSAPSQPTGVDAANTAPDEAAGHPVVASSTSQDPQGATVASSWSMTPVFAPVLPVPSDSASWLRFWLALPTRLG